MKQEVNSQKINHCKIDHFGAAGGGGNVLPKYLFFFLYRLQRMQYSYSGVHVYTIYLRLKLIFDYVTLGSYAIQQFCHPFCSFYY